MRDRPLTTRAGDVRSDLTHAEMAGMRPVRDVHPELHAYGLERQGLRERAARAARALDPEILARIADTGPGFAERAGAVLRGALDDGRI
jgi:uncharacterized protein (DUF4415 family)